MTKVSTEETTLPWSFIEDLPESDNDEYAHCFIGDVVAAAIEGRKLKALCGIIKVPDIDRDKPYCPKCVALDRATL